MKKKLVCLIIILCIIILSLCFHPVSLNRIERIWELWQWNSGKMQVILYDPRSEEELQQIANTSYAEILRLDSIINEHRKDSIAGLVGHALENGEKIQGTEEIVHLLQFAIKMYEDSQGLFDITIAPLLNLWKESAKNNQLPTEDQIISCQKRLGVSKIHIQQNYEIVADDILSINLGGFSKGYAIDKVAEVLKSQNIENGMVNLGGDLYCFGKKIWTIGIQNPINANADSPNSILATIQVQNKAVATSGHYRRFVEIQGKHYSHIINPTTGLPVDNEILSVTVIADNAMIADAYATVFTMTAPEVTMEYAKKYNLQVLLITKDQQFLMTPDFPTIYYSKL